MEAFYTGLEMGAAVFVFALALTILFGLHRISEYQLQLIHREINTDHMVSELYSYDR